jgi:predicted nucleic acid-binding protein
MKKPKAIVLDSWAVMAYLEDEPAAEKIANTIADAHDDGTPLLMTVVNAGEVWYIVARRRSTGDADHALQWLNEIGVRLVDVDWALTKIAAGFKTKGNISYADCYAAALARSHQAHLLTGDEEFRTVENDIQITWVP